MGTGIGDRRGRRDRVWLLQSLLFELSPLDPATYAAAAAMLLGICALAAWLPARRAASADPMRALRSE